MTADVGNFGLLNVSSTATFSIAAVSANAVTVNNTPVSLSGHTHSISEVTGLSSYATQQYVIDQISAAIGVVLSSAF